MGRSNRLERSKKWEGVCMYNSRRGIEKYTPKMGRRMARYENTRCLNFFFFLTFSRLFFPSKNQ